MLEAILASRRSEKVDRPPDALDLEGRRLGIAEAVPELVAQDVPRGLGELDRSQACAEEMSVGVYYI